MFIVDAKEESYYDDSPNPVADIMSVELFKGKVCSCPALRPFKGKEKENSKGMVEYSFDISKADQIFDYLLKDKSIRLLRGHEIPPLEELKAKKYCKCHNSLNHASSKCILFKKAIQKAIKEGRFKLVDKGIEEMILDSDIFYVMEINMVFFSGSDKGKGRKNYQQVWVPNQIALLRNLKGRTQ